MRPLRCTLGIIILLISQETYSEEIMSEKEINTDDDTHSKDWGSYQHIIVRGLPFLRGQSHGSQAKEKIILNINHYKSGTEIPPWDESVSYVRRNYLPAIEKYFPSGLEELKGIAAGASVPFDDILVINSRYDLSRIMRNRRLNSRVNTEENLINNKTIFENGESGDECTGALALKSATLNRHVIIGQNWDFNDFILKYDTAILLEVHPDPSENKKPLIMLTEAGTLGRSGMNQNGLGVVAMSLHSTKDHFEGDPEKHPYGWMPISFFRRMFLESPNFSAGLRTILQVPRHVSNSLILATDEDEALNIEITPDEYFVIKVPYEKEILAHSNSFKSPSFMSRSDIQDGNGPSSTLFRDRRVEKELHKAVSYISEFHFQKAFKDHVSHPLSVCLHPVPKELVWTAPFPNDSTVASVIYNLSTRTMKLCKGPPCQGTFKDYTFSKN